MILIISEHSRYFIALYAYSIAFPLAKTLKILPPRHENLSGRLNICGWSAASSGVNYIVFPCFFFFSQSLLGQIIPSKKKVTSVCRSPVGSGMVFTYFSDSDQKQQGIDVKATEKTTNGLSLCEQTRCRGP